jgi:hypothetical protein
VAGGGDRSLPPAGDAVVVEGSAPAGHDRAGTVAVVTVWLFHSGRAPRRVDPAELPALVADDAKVAFRRRGWLAPDGD